ncbi:MAG TPA: NADH-quinone oxidoreductase subunit L [Anaerolineae bacterium]|nr:NADH-quinone oxidoreductase subunit L [Anaerolineae bacterium]HOQ98389.1 NADH-quinone oxidoreductase subunit L [Anaerolineae bacterium]HPL26499.1 NADH-quinone oxidoreductase subunit L [Anaerolineae bacterium]
MLDYVWLIVLFPLVGVLINAFFGYRLGRRASGIIATVAVGLSFVVALGILAGLLGLPAEERSLSIPLFDWIAAGDFHVDVSFLVDPLAAVMLLVVTGVGTLIHVYSNGYMAHDPDYARFFTYLNLFIVGMLFLVLAGNFLLLYLGWEAVGLCSYLLIGFWYHKKPASDAGKKAFIVNRVGDFGFCLGIILIFLTFKSLDFNAVFANAGQVAPAAITAITLLLFMGAAGKSAQIPLYIWLPDAMEGPTPVSALIHAATMVTAGVYMVARTHALYALAPFSSGLVATVGGLTAFYAATIAMVQTDIKRVLAYSTISQLGYMFLAVGVGAYAAGIFHLTTHAFFKALLFLGAGSVIHAMSGDQDMRHMGGLFKKLRVTGATFIVAWLAIAGVPPLAGFFSKDEILAAAYHSGYWPLWLLGLVTAALTAFYMSRAVFMTFFGKSHVSPEAAHHLHESPTSMTAPLVVLAVLAAVAGFAASWFTGFLTPVLGVAHGAPAAEGLPEAVLIGLSIVAAAVGIAVAWFVYLKRGVTADAEAARLGRVYGWVQNGYNVNELYWAILVRPIGKLAGWLATVFDARAIDGAVNGVALALRGLGRRLRGWQSGYVRQYALSVVVGVVIVTTVALVMVGVV